MFALVLKLCFRTHRIGSLLVAALVAAATISGTDARAWNDQSEQADLMKILREVPNDLIQQATGDAGGAVDGVREIKSEIMMRTGNGDNLPYPGSDYLGIGYNLIEGNPEGDPMTQMDPGFRAPVIVSLEVHAPVCCVA